MIGIAEWMSRVLLPGQCVELRGLKPGGGAASRHFLATAEGLASLETLAKEWESEGVACYFTPNPVSPDLGDRAAKDADVLCRRWLLIDVEAVRPAGTSTTKEEKDAAWATTSRVLDLLEGNDFPTPVIADSGNGFHLLLPCELPSDAASATLCKTFLAGMAHVYGSATVKIDTVNYNASRIVRLYGTMNRKGVHSTERPHRRSWVCTLPEEYDGKRGAAAIEVVVDRWQRQERMAAKTKPASPSIAADAVRRARAYLSRADPAVEGQGGSQTCFRVACALVHGFSLTDDEAMEAIGDWNATCSPPWSDKELRHKLSDARKHSDHTKPRGHLLVEEGQPARPTPATRLLSQPAKQGEPDEPAVPMPADVLMVQEYPELPCVVGGMIPKGLTLLAGRPKQGKSWAALQMCLNVAMGLPFFGKEVEQGDVLYLALEDHPRRIKARIHQLLGEPPYPETLARLSFLFGEQVPPGDMRSVEAWLASAEKPRLVVIDTLGRFTPPSGRSGESFEQIYAVMAAVKSLADANNVAIVIIHHTRKTEAENPIDAVSGSTAYTAAADAIMVLERNATENDATLYVTARDFEQYELNIQWANAWCVGGGGRQKGAGKGGGSDKGPPLQLGRAIAFLNEQLKQPTRVKDILDAAAALPEPISNGAVYRARDTLGLVESKILNKKYWELPGKESGRGEGKPE